jgi:hypothetical protein
MNVLLKGHEWEEGNEEEEDESFRAVSIGTDGSYIPQWRGLERDYFQGEAETVYS